MVSANFQQKRNDKNSNRTNELQEKKTQTKNKPYEQFWPNETLISNFKMSENVVQTQKTYIKRSPNQMKSLLSNVNGAHFGKHI